VTTVVFYGKPGCVTNARQQALLCALGHRLEVRDLLQEHWTAGRLRPFFGTRPVADWFNPTAPRIKSGEVLPAALDEAAARALVKQSCSLARTVGSLIG
jgi:nitrogenase-associated protein